MRCLAVAVADGDHLTVSVLAAIATVQSALLCLAQRNRYGWVCAPHVCHVCHVWLWVAVWLCGCVAVWLCVCVAVWLCGCVAVWLCGYVAAWLWLWLWLWVIAMGLRCCY